MQFQQRFVKEPFVGNNTLDSLYPILHVHLFPCNLGITELHWNRSTCGIQDLSSWNRGCWDRIHRNREDSKQKLPKILHQNMYKVKIKKPKGRKNTKKTENSYLYNPKWIPWQRKSISYSDSVWITNFCRDLPTEAKTIRSRSKRNTRSKHTLFNCSWWLISTSCLLRWVSQPIPEASATAAAASGGGRWSREGRVWSRADPTKAAWSSPFPAWSFSLGCGWLHPDKGCVLLCCCCCGGFCCFPFLASVSYRGFPPCTHN